MLSERILGLHGVDMFELKSADVDRQSAAEMCGPELCVIGRRPAIMSCIKSARICGCITRRESPRQIVILPGRNAHHSMNSCSNLA